MVKILLIKADLFNLTFNGLTHPNVNKNHKLWLSELKLMKVTLQVRTRCDLCFLSEARIVLLLLSEARIVMPVMIQHRKPWNSILLKSKSPVLKIYFNSIYNSGKIRIVFSRSWKFVSNKTTKAIYANYPCVYNAILRKDSLGRVGEIGWMFAGKNLEHR